MSGTFSPFGPAHLDALAQAHAAKLEDSLAFSRDFDARLLLGLLATEYNARWKDASFSAQFTDVTELQQVTARPFEPRPLTFWMQRATEASEHSATPRQLTHLLFEQLCSTWLGEDPLAEALELHMEYEAGAGEQFAALATNYASVRVAICGYGLHDYNHRRGFTHPGAAGETEMWSGVLRLDMAVWSVPVI